MSEQKSHITIRLLKILGWIMLSLVLLAGVLRLSLKTEMVHNLVKSQAVSIGNEYLNGEFSIGGIDGDLWNDFSIQNIEIRSEEDTLVYLEKFHLQYNIWDLVNRTFTASDLQLSGLYANIREIENGAFNLQRLVKTDTTADTTASSFGIDLQHITLENSDIDLWAPSFLPDSALKVNQLSATAGFQLFDEISGSLDALSFRLQEGRLPEPINFEMAASYQNEIVTLDQLLLDTGRSLLKANGRSDLADSTLSAELTTRPFALSDLGPYLETSVPDDKLQLSLNAGGRLDSLNLELKGEGTGFNDLLVVSNLTVGEIPTLNKFGFSVKNIDLAHFTNDSVQAHIGELQGTVEGRLTQNIENTDITWGATAHRLQYEDYALEILFGSGTVEEGTAQATVEARDGNDHIVTYTNIYQLFSDTPQWDIRTHFDDIDLGWWLRNPEIEGDVNFRALIEGQGFELTENPWTFKITKPEKPTFKSPDGKDLRLVPQGSFQKNASKSWVRDTVIINGQKFADLDVDGSITKDVVEADGFLQLIENKIEFSANISDYLEEQPNYTFSIGTQRFNAQELVGAEDFPTSINLNINGEGSSFDPETIRLSSILKVDSSFVNGASLDSLSIVAEFEDNILTIPRGQLQSEVLEGTFSVRRNIMDVTDPQNDIALDMEIKNTQPLAQLAAVNVLSASGNISGNITNESEDQLEFAGNVDLNDVRYDTLFSAQNISGETFIMISENYGFETSLNITEPVINQSTLEDVNLQTKGVASADSVYGSFSFDINSSDAGRISQTGNYHVIMGSWKTNVIWNAFDFKTPARTLSLQQPFQLRYADATLQTDTLKLESDGGTFLNLAIPYADSLSQNIWAEGQDFDFGVIQEIMFNERFVDGVLSGNLEIHNNPDSLRGSGALNFSQLAYQGTEIDLLKMDFDLQQERLNANLDVTMNGEQKMYGSLELPFIPADPATLSDAFFEESVQGELDINPVALSEFKNLLSEFDITETDGIISFQGQLSGTAGNPDMKGVFQLSQPTLSGVKIDSAFAEIHYHHQQEKVTGVATINARGQQAASIDAESPVSLNFQTFEFSMPEPTDTVRVNVLTDQFNISVFNDFLDEEFMQNLRGMLNAELNIEGPFNEVQPSGFVSLHSGNLRIPAAGISLSSINSELEFSKSGLNLNSFSMKSGGTFTANGQIDLDGLSPTGMNINAKAARFQAANTDNYNLTVDLDSKISGNPLRPEVSGRLAVKNGFIFLQDFGEKSVEAVTLEDEEVSSFSPYDSLSIDMQFEIERNFLIRNRRYLDMEVALSGELDGQKSVDQDLELFGTLNAERGYARPLGKQFNMDEGNFTFSGPLAEPEIFIRTSYIPQTAQKQTGNPITLFYIIEGNAQDPTFRFESEPYMEQQDIICYTLFNKPCYALESWQQVVSGGGSSPTDLLVDVLLDEVETLATQQLGIDVVQIDNSGSEGKTSIKTGWYLNRRTFFSVINQISGTTPETLFILEYLLNQNLDLIITQGDDNRQGIDLRWQYDY